MERLQCDCLGEMRNGQWLVIDLCQQKVALKRGQQSLSEASSVETIDLRSCSGAHMACESVICAFSVTHSAHVRRPTQL